MEKDNKVSNYSDSMGTISSDLSLRIKQQESKPFSKIEMGRSFIHQVVRERLKTIINKMIKDLIIEEKERSKWSEVELDFDGKISHISDKQFEELVKAFVPFFEICTLCKADKQCRIQERIIEANMVLYAGLQQAFPNIDISSTFTLCKCGLFEVIDTKKLMSGYAGSRLRGGK